MEKEGATSNPEPSYMELQQVLAEFGAVSLQDMTEVALMKRMDTKFVVSSRRLGPLLESVKGEYEVLEIEKSRSHSYASLYFDTPGYKFYAEHHNRKLRRSKVRMRKYLDSDNTFFEIKQKDPKGQTSKIRRPVIDMDPALITSHEDFLRQTLEQDLLLHPTVGNSFDRITLVHKWRKERVTIDSRIRFFFESELKDLDGVSVIEVKQERVNRSTAVYQHLKKNNIRPMRFSKYCIGMVSLNPDIKYNRFKQKIMHLNKMI